MSHKNETGGKMKHKVLWIEDGAFVEVSSFAAPVINRIVYALEVALDVSDAVKKIIKTQFDAVIVDIRIPPGSDPEWEHLYSKSGYNKIGARLGIQLLFSLLKPEAAAIKLDKIPPWVSPGKFGIFTVESEAEVKNDLEVLGITFFQQKKTNIPNIALLELIEKIIRSSNEEYNTGGK
jgi:hypothetical protein